ncbi:LamG-like jellyroll fold domain-containing protein [Gaetbulibacter sp. M240]|uniref:LamG-like jellyroll fold domain-containing protein n=1 Tax=Gaetbulibacter sp. M240 TaxID=3126511 RepID=UPI00374E578A
MTPKRLLLVFLLLFLVNWDSYSQLQPAPSFFRIPREAPLVDLNTTQTILVSDYGAVVNDGTNDISGITAAIQAAVNLATEASPVRLVFENGTYDLMPPSGSHALSMTDAESVLWDGQGAEFLIHDPAIGFLRLLRCTNTIIKDISVDYATLPFTQGKITNIDFNNGFFDFEVDANFPLPTENYFSNASQAWGMIKNIKGGIKEGTANLIPFTGFSAVGPNTFRTFQSSPYMTGIEVGDYFVQIARNNGSTIILNNLGKNVTYMNVTAYASPAGGFNARDCEAWHVLDSHIKLKAGRVHSINADCLHINGGKIAPWVENCTFEGFSDDCVNLKYTKRVIKEVHNATQITVQFSVSVGENMEFYNPRDGVFLGSATVENVENLGSNLFKLTLSNAVNITTITDPDHQLADKAYVESRSNDSFIFRNNIIRNSRRYGILIQSKYALIENNLFQNLSSSGITIENGVDWGEGFRATEIEIRNNTFDNCGFDTSYISDENSAAIKIDFLKLGSPCSVNDTWCGTQTTSWKAHSNIRIIDNTILYNNKGLYLKNIDGLSLQNNFICHRDEDITLGNNETPVAQTILNSSNVSVADYQYTLPEPNIHFLLNEDPGALELVNSGTDTSVGLEIINQGGEIIQGFSDEEIGYAFKINTANNGRLRFENTADGSPFPGPVGGAARTYAFWFKPETSVFQTLLYSGGPTDGEVFVVQMQSNGVLRVTDNNQNIVRMDDLPIDIGQWNHVVISVPENNSFSSIQLYKNGVPSSETYIGVDVLLNTASNSIDFFPRFNGLASDIRYFDYKLCSGEVERIYNDRQNTLSTEFELNNKTNKIVVYPTMVSNTIYFSKPVTSVKICNLLGQIFTEVKYSNLTELNLSDLPSGMYILQLNNIQTEKIYKK